MQIAGIATSALRAALRWTRAPRVDAEAERAARTFRSGNCSPRLRMATPLFSRWANPAFRGGLVAAAAVLVLTPVLLMAAAREPPVTGQGMVIEQPVEFDHRHHCRDDGIDCRYCHDGAQRSSYAGVPPTSRCMGCHAQVWPRAAMLEPVRRSAESGVPIHWQRVHRLPDYVYFDHAAHTTRGVGCASCHGRVDLMAKVYQAEPLTMGWCLDCHRHPQDSLRPLERIADMEWAPSPQRQQQLGAELAERWHIAPPTDCSGCHR